MSVANFRPTFSKKLYTIVEGLIIGLIGLFLIFVGVYGYTELIPRGSPLYLPFLPDIAVQIILVLLGLLFLIAGIDFFIFPILLKKVTITEEFVYVRRVFFLPETHEILIQEINEVSFRYFYPKETKKEDIDNIKKFKEIKLIMSESKWVIIFFEFFNKNQIENLKKTIEEMCQKNNIKISTLVTDDDWSA